MYLFFVCFLLILNDNIMLSQTVIYGTITSEENDFVGGFFFFRKKVSL